MLRTSDQPRRDTAAGLLFALPALLGVTLFIALPFVLYFAINWDSLPLGVGVGILLVFSMLFLVIFG